MNPCCLEREGEELLRRILDILDPELINRLIVLPLEKAGAAFRWDRQSQGGDLAPAAFLDVIGAFIQKVYAEGLRNPKRLDEMQAQAEAVFILERSYQGLGGRGYEAALVDCISQGSEGLQQTLRFLLGAVAHAERRRHLQWALGALLDPLDWGLRKEIASLLIKQTHDILPPDISNAPPERFVECLPDMLLNYVEARSELQHTLGAGLSPSR